MEKGVPAGKACSGSGFRIPAEFPQEFATKPQTMADVGNPNGNTHNLCWNHGQASDELLTAYARTFIGTETKEAQDDNMLLLCLRTQLVTTHTHS